MSFHDKSVLKTFQKIKQGKPLEETTLEYTGSLFNEERSREKNRK